MSALRRVATGAVAAFAIVLAVPAVGADAAAKPRRFETLANVNGGKVQACRMPTKASEPVIIKLRVDATKASSRVSGSGQATSNDNLVGKGWKSGPVAPATSSWRASAPTRWATVAASRQGPSAPAAEPTGARHRAPSTQAARA